MDNILKFGKYKGQPVKKIILTHIGYIMWCLDNLNWFKLNEDEQELYDAMAIAIVKYDIDMVFPIDKMVSFIKNKEAFDNKTTPFRLDGNGNIWPEDIKSPIVQGVLKYQKNIQVSIRNTELLAGLSRQFEISFDDDYGMMTDPTELFY